MEWQGTTQFYKQRISEDHSQNAKCVGSSIIAIEAGTPLNVMGEVSKVHQV